MSVKIWLQAMRVPFFFAFLLPAFLGAALAYRDHHFVDWALLGLVTAEVLFIAAATNLYNDYYDFRRGVDQHSSIGSSRVLLDGLLTPPQLLRGARFALAAAILLCLVLVVERGWPMLSVVILGLLGSYFYTGGPLGYKYFAFGEPLVFILLGPLLAVGSYLALTGDLRTEVLLISLPIACLVAAILNGNNIRDLEADRRAGIKTLPILLGGEKAKYIYYGLIGGAYLSVVVLVRGMLLGPWSLLTLLTSPLAVKLVYQLAQNDPLAVRPIDLNTAKVHLLFGIILILAVLSG